MSYAIRGHLKGLSLGWFEVHKNATAVHDLGLNYVPTGGQNVGHYAIYWPGLGWLCDAATRYSQDKNITVLANSVNEWVSMLLENIFQDQDYESLAGFCGKGLRNIICWSF